MTVYTYGSTTLADGVNLFMQEKDFGFPDHLVTLAKVSRLEGVKKTSEVVNDRQVVVKIRVVGTSRADLESRLSSLYQGLTLRQQRLSIYTLDTRYFICDAVAAKPTLVAGMPTSAVVPITFLCQQPYAFAVSTSTFSTGTATFSASSGTYTLATQTFPGGGTVFSRPQVRVQITNSNFTWTSVQVAQITDNYTISTVQGMPSFANDYLDFFCDPLTPSNGYTVQKNSSGTPLAFSGIFPVLEPTNTSWVVTITAATSTSVQANVTWTWTQRFA